ncbi:hypothetical protein UY3_04062 [Chelonia mydas]|uniref:Uncharacterized protein n=1 Tax=Chelonia mydas TaxID=8469 RepID=M7C2W0_CHEMY|nr:hypothetical protein UY3_04062 [Chelonia mydas]
MSPKSRIRHFHNKPHADAITQMQEYKQKEGEALGKEEPDRGEGLWQPGLLAAEYPEDLEGPDCSPGQRESDTEGERGWPAAEYLEEPELPAADYAEEMEDPELPAAEYTEEMEGPERPA